MTNAIGSFPNSTKNQISNVQNKFQTNTSATRDASPKNAQLNNSLSVASNG